jgi:hypothetical protein
MMIMKFSFHLAYAVVGVLACMQPPAPVIANHVDPGPLPQQPLHDHWPWWADACKRPDNPSWAHCAKLTASSLRCGCCALWMTSADCDRFLAHVP